jgi:hypothetical protein
MCVFEDSAIAAVKRLEASCGNINAPFIHCFPKSCCELISVHLGLTLKKTNPHQKVKVVKAYNRSSDEWHFWVEVDKLVLDLTAHQFGQHSDPLVCAKPSPLENFFPDIERISPREAKCAASFDINHDIETILAVFTS